MASRPPLAVWLYGRQIGVLSEPQYGKLRFDFAAEAETRFGLGSVILSTLLPVDSRRRPRGDLVRVWFDALLPEAGAKRRIEELFGVRAGDDFGLLAAIGRDCAGAVELQPADLGRPTSSGSVQPLAPGELERLIRGLPDRPLGADDEVRVSLAGAQEKLLLAKTADGEWGRPINGEPSTYLLKPQDMRFEGYAAGEALCLRLAAALDLTTVEVELLEVDGRPTVAVSRYDRDATPGGVVRVHQEDAGQALGVDTTLKPEQKYEADGGPSLRRLAGILAQHAPGDRRKLLAITTLNVVVGNADAHARNLSLLHAADGSVRLAPAYDITPTTYYRGIPTRDGPRDMSDRLGMFVNGKRSVHDVDRDDLVAEGASWGMPRAEAAAVVGDTTERLGDLIGPLADESAVPSAMTTWLGERQHALANGRTAGHR